MTVLGLDVGTRRIGIAVGNTELKLASPLRVVRRLSLRDDADRIRALVDEYGAEKIVVGLPLELDGSIGAQAKSVIHYIDRLQPLLALPFDFFDERYSTSQALSTRRAAGLSDKRGRPTIDAAAAAVILQDYFDAPGDAIAQGKAQGSSGEA